jgi:voltage-dependent potassium channel beta subunit
MLYRNLGRSGVQVSALSYGSWVSFGTQVDTSLAEKTMSAAYDLGINFFDNAEGYARGQSETIMGEALKKCGWRRDSFLVSSKVFFGSVEKAKPNQNGLSRKHIVEACEQAMKRLQVDYLDLYFCHRPDPKTPIEETVRAMTDLVRQGKVLYWGTSEWSAAEIALAWGYAQKYNLVAPTMEQPQYNLFEKQKVEKEYARLYEEIGLGTTIWSPLASGILTGKYSQGIPDGARLGLPGYEWLRDAFATDEGKKKIRQTDEVKKIADRLGIPVARLAIAWCLKNPHVSTVILGASKTEQLTENVKALDALDLLSESVMKEIEACLSK